MGSSTTSFPWSCLSVLLHQYTASIAWLELSTLGVRLSGLIWSNYYDDDPQVDIAKSGDAAQQTAEDLFDPAGLRYSTKPAKRLPMSSTFIGLGVDFDFCMCDCNKVLARNKETRV